MADETGIEIQRRLVAAGIKRREEQEWEIEIDPDYLHDTMAEGIDR